MNKRVVVGLIAGIILVSLVIALNANPSRKGSAGERIGLINVEGTITGSGSDSGLFGQGAGGPSIMEQLRQAAEDDSIKAVLIRINSPGGSAAASQEIGEEIDKVRARNKVVVVSMGDVAASGGYWIAAKADRIVANPATMTGSIGVIMETTSLQQLYNKIGVTPQTIKSGPFKDIGSPNRPMTPEERDILQGMVNNIYEQFLDVVVKGRHMDRAKVRALADGRIFTGSQAKEQGLVDELGNFYDSVEVTKKLAKIKGEPVIYELSPRSPFTRLFGQVGTMLGLNRYSSALSPREVETLREILASGLYPQNR